MNASLDHSRFSPQCASRQIQCSGGHVGGYLCDGSTHGEVGGHLFTACQCRAAAAVFVGTVIAVFLVCLPELVMDELPECRTRPHLAAASLSGGDRYHRSVGNIFHLVSARAAFLLPLRGGRRMLLAVGIGPLVVARLTVELTFAGEQAMLHRLRILFFLTLKQLLDVLFGATSNNIRVPVLFLVGFFHFHWSRQPPAFDLETAAARQESPVLRSPEDITASISGPTIAWAVARKSLHGLPCGPL
ncbi:uncharacterized protein LOC142777136 [Rhipicephalus microplus]|uniref:uncharacterized protein LOC142777136 n=1 Tax=Rhipicephalus microplus TaxID=6941 RepID=UPI003F6A5AEE